MKRFLRILTLAFVAATTVSLASCEKDNKNDDPVNPGGQTLTSLAGTSWVGVFNDTYQGYEAVMTWSLDFNDETNGELFFEITVGGQSQPSMNTEFTYTFDGVNGVMDAGEMGGAPFTYDAETNTILMNLMVEVEGDGATLGGMTTFYLRGQEPGGGDEPDDPGVEPGEITEDFPAYTVWEASEETDYNVPGLGTLPMTLTYTLTFNNDHTAYIDISATILDQTSDGSRAAMNWDYDAATKTGNFIIKGGYIPFTYNETNNTLESELNFSADGMQLSDLVFHRVSKKNVKTVRVRLK